MLNIISRSTRRRIARSVPILAMTVVVLSLLSCENLLDTRNPDFVLPDNLEGPEAIPTLVQGAVADFSLAYAGAPIGGGSTEGIVTASGILADEFVHSGTFPSRREMDSRTIDIRNGQVTLLFRNLQRARRSAERAAVFIEANAEDPAADARLARTLNLAGYTYVFAAENFCSGVPFSQTTADGSFEFGEPLTTSQIFDVALERFDAALTNAQSSVSATQEYLATLGTARVLLDRGNFAGAATAAAGVPTDFLLELEHSINTSLQENGIYTINAVFERWSIGEGDGGNGLLFLGPGGVLDIRVPWIRTGGGTDLGFDRATPQYDLLKYPGRDKRSIVASGIEARLIEAEAALQSGDATAWIQFLNDLRASVADLLTREHLDALRDQLGIDGPAVSLTALADPGSLDARVDLHFSERAFWLFATGQRLSDLRRLVRQYGRAADSVFPTGAYFKGGTYGPDVNFIVPFDEENNPNFVSCLDRNP